MNTDPTDDQEETNTELAGLVRQMSELSPLAMAAVTRRASRLSYINPALCQLIGGDLSGLIGLPIQDVLGEGETPGLVSERLQRKEQPEKSDGTPEVPADSHALTYVMWPVLGGNGTPLGIVVQVADAAPWQQQAAEMNQSLLLAGLRQHELAEAAEKQNVQMQQEIRDRKRAEEALNDFVASLEIRVAERTFEVHHQANRLRALASELGRVEQRERKRLARILHDHIQQLMAAAVMQIDWMKRDISPERRQEAVQQADAMLREAIEASRSLARDLSPPALHEAGLVGGLSWLASDMKQKHRQTLHLHLNSEAEPESDEIRLLLFECARELLFNAVKHSGTDEATVTLTREEGQIVLTIADQGAGFHEAELETGEGGKASFGLFSVQERLKHMGGHVKITSAPGEGATITLTAPSAAARAPEPAPRSATPSKRTKLSEPVKRKAVRVMIVDDHSIVREGLAGLLMAEPNIEIAGEAADGQGAIALAESKKPDVVIMDVNLGEMSGVEATRRIVAQNPDIKVIGLSMQTDEHVASQMQAAGASNYLTKGGPAKDLIDAIHTCMTA